MQCLSTSDREAELSCTIRELSIMCNALRQIVEALDESELEFLVGAPGADLLALADELETAKYEIIPSDDLLDDDDGDKDGDEDRDDDHDED